MKLRTIIGFGIGYVLGTRSQAEGVNDPQDLVKSVTQSDAFKTVFQQARQLAASGMEAITGQEPSWAPQSADGSGSAGGNGSGGEQGSSEQSSEEGSSEEESSSESSSSGSS